MKMRMRPETLEVLSVRARWHFPCLQEGRGRNVVKIGLQAYYTEDDEEAGMEQI